MATDEVGIANMALSMIGEEPISALDEDNKPARFINAIYNSERQIVLRAGRWNSATRRVALALTDDTPTWGFTRSFQLPSDFLRLADTQEFKEPHRIEGDRFLSDLSTANITYVFDQTDIAAMDPLFQDAFAAKLAQEICIALTGNRELMRDMRRHYQDKLNEARYMDAQEAPIQQVEGSAWFDARTGGDVPFRPIAS